MSTSRSEDADSVEDPPSDLARAAQEDLKTAPPEVGGPGEFIERANGYTFLLHVPGGISADMAVEVLADRLKGGSIYFQVERCFPERVKPETATSSCVNGVLSIRVSKSL